MRQLQRKSWNTPTGVGITLGTVSDQVFGQLKIANSPFRFRRFPESRDLQAGLPGHRNREILGTRLNDMDQRISDLEHRGVISRKESEIKALTNPNRDRLAACRKLLGALRYSR